MRKVALIGAFILGASFLSAPVLAQQKTVKACQEEWRENKAANHAKGITEKAYVAQCRTGTAAAAPAPSAPTQAPPPAAKPAATPRTLAPAARPSAPAAPTTAMPTGANQYSTEAQAKARCSSGTVVWANLSSKIYHFAGHKSYGHTKSGVYMCESDAVSQGIRAAKNEKHP